MAIQSDLPFRFEIYTLRRNGQKDICNNSPINFYDDISDLNGTEYNPEILVKENTDVYVFVQTETPFMLEMEGMDILPVPTFRHGQQFYLNEANREIKVFSHEDFPLSPGEYVITVTCDGKKFYTGFSVGTVRLSPELWEQMANETFDEIKEMAQHLVRQKLGIYSDRKLDAQNISKYYKIVALEESYFKVIAALNDLKNNPHCRIVKKYVLTEKGDRKSLSDFRSVSLNKRKRYIDKTYVPNKFKDYNISENRYVKRVITNIKNLIQSFIDESNSVSSDISSEMISLARWRTGTQLWNCKNVINSIGTVVDKARKIKYAITLLEECEWYKNIKDAQVDYFPTQSILDPRYGVLDKLNKKLKATTIGFLEKSNLAIAWKRSSELYELWGFIQIVKSLNMLGFELVDGAWIVHEQDRIRLGGLKSNDVIRMKSTDILISLTFNGTLPRKASDTNLINPIYMLEVCNHVTPDCRIDFYFNGSSESSEKIMYLGSLIVDFKYRAYQNIWSDKPDIETSKEQLYSYGIFAKSKFLFGKSEMYSNNALKPVYEVWALHPDNRYKVDRSHGEYGVSLFSLVPGETNVLQEQLGKFIDIYIRNRIEV